MTLRKLTPAVFATLFLGLSFGSPAYACSTDGWHEVVGLNTTIFVGSPTPDFIQRVEALCGMRAEGQGHVGHYEGLSHHRARFRFYARSQLSGGGEAKVFVLYDADPVARGPGPAELFNIRHSGDSGNWIFDASPNGGTSTSIAGTTGFDLIEIDWNTDANTVDIWVNADSVGADNFPPSADAPPTATITSGPAATAELARLGLPDGLPVRGALAGTVTFDQYQANSTMAIGSHLRGDSNGDAAVNGLDFQSTQLDIGGVLQPGFPDCDLSGGVNGLDFQCVQIAIAGGFGGR